MNAVTSPTEGVDTLSAWLTAYLAAPEGAGKTSFTVAELLAAAGMQNDEANDSAMGRALRLNGMRSGMRSEPPRLRAWWRPRPPVMHASQEGLPKAHLGEIFAVTPDEAKAIKAFITQAPDTFRAPFPPVPAPSLDDLEARAREAVQATAERAAARHWALFREGSLDILGRLSCAIAIHKLQAQSAIDIPEARP